MAEKKTFREKLSEANADHKANAKERRRLKTLKTEQNLRERESKRKVREKKGGAGLTVTLWDIAPPTKVRKGKR